MHAQIPGGMPIAEARDHARSTDDKNTYTHIIICIHIFTYTNIITYMHIMRGGGLGSRPKNLYGETLGDGVEYHLMKPTPRR